jgi:hypothetical protein
VIAVDLAHDIGIWNGKRKGRGGRRPVGESCCWEVLADGLQEVNCLQPQALLVLWLLLRVTKAKNEKRIRQSRERRDSRKRDEAVEEGSTAFCATRRHHDAFSSLSSTFNLLVALVFVVLDFALETSFGRQEAR